MSDYLNLQVAFTQEAVFAFMKRVDRPVTARDVAVAFDRGVTDAARMLFAMEGLYFLRRRGGERGVPMTWSL